MPKKKPDIQTAPALVYASKAGGPRLYIGATLVGLHDEEDAARSRIMSTTLGEWFDELDITIQRPPSGRTPTR